MMSRPVQGRPALACGRDGASPWLGPAKDAVSGGVVWHVGRSPPALLGRLAERKAFPFPLALPYAGAMPDPGIHNWLRLDSRVTTSGQPTEAELPLLRALGVRHVINLALHTHERALPDEAGSVRALGMAYAHIPVAFDHPTEADFTRFRAAFEATGNDPVHVHCIMNWRVSAFLYRYRRDVLGWDEAAARADMARIWEPDAVWAEFVARRGA